MKTCIYITRKCLYISLITTALSGCIENKPDQFPEPPVGGEETTIQVVLTITGMNIPATRAMDGEKENEVNEVDILAFRDDGNGNQQLAYHRQGTLISQSGDGITYTVTFELSLPIGTNYNLSIIANAHAVIEALLSGEQIREGDTKLTVLSLLQYPHTGKWTTNNTYTPIPMYGESGLVDITGQMNLTGVDMIRMVAAIDVENTTPDFTLVAVYVCNYNTNGLIPPAWDSQGNSIPAVPSVPNLPQQTGKQTGSYQVFPVESGMNSLKRSIYTLEAQQALDINENSRMQSVCLILEGKYAGETWFYRVDFTDASGHYMPLLRNFLYTVSITNVQGIGYPSISEALASYTVVSNLRTRILSYNLSVIRELKFNGQNMLGTEKTAYAFTGEGYLTPRKDNTVFVYTDYTGGWVIQAITGDNGLPVSWLTVIPASGPGGLLSSVVLSIEENNTGTTRHAQLTFRAGRLDHLITVTQLPAILPR